MATDQSSFVFIRGSPEKTNPIWRIIDIMSVLTMAYGARDCHPFGYAQGKLSGLAMTSLPGHLRALAS